MSWAAVLAALGLEIVMAVTALGRINKLLPLGLLCVVISGPAFILGWHSRSGLRTFSKPVLTLFFCVVVQFSRIMLCDIWICSFVVL